MARQTRASTTRNQMMRIEAVVELNADPLRITGSDQKNSSAEQQKMVEIAHIVCACVNVDTWVIQQTENGTIEVCVDCFLGDVNNKRLSRASTPEIQS